MKILDCQFLPFGNRNQRKKSDEVSEFRDSEFSETFRKNSNSRDGIAPLVQRLSCHML